MRTGGGRLHCGEILKSWGEGGNPESLKQLVGDSAVEKKRAGCRAPEPEVNGKKDWTPDVKLPPRNPGMWWQHLRMPHCHRSTYQRRL
jgi:hypothetical protein